MFSVYDVDGDGTISIDDLELITRMLTGNTLTYGTWMMSIHSGYILPQGGAAAGRSVQDVSGGRGGRQHGH